MMVENDKVKYICAAVSLFLIAAMLFFLPFGHEMKMWAKIVFTIIGLISIYPGIVRKEKIKEHKEHDTDETVFIIGQWLLEAAFTVTLISNFFVTMEILDKYFKTGIFWFAELMGVHYLTVALLAYKQGKKVLLVLIFGILTIFAAALCGGMYMKGKLPDTRLFSICFLLPIPAAIRLAVMEGYGHIY